jgi:hypothetical protein
MKKSHSFFICLLILSFLLRASHAHEILVNTQDGETFVFDIDPSESLNVLQDKIASLSNGKTSNLLIEISEEGRSKGFGMHLAAARSQGGYLGYPRNYYKEVESEDKANIRLIVTTLANKSLIAIAIAKGELEDAGNDIDHLHPLRFLMTVFTDEELKVGIRNIRGKGWVWNHFIGGLKDCLATEAQIGNMKEEYVLHFSKIVQIDPKIIIPTISAQRWEDFVDQLITHIPRKGDHDRYDT